MQVQEYDTRTLTICITETALKCRNMQEQVINAVENWADTLPESEIGTQIGVIESLRSQAQELRDQITFEASEKDKINAEMDRLTQKLQVTTDNEDESKATIKRLSGEIGKRDEQMIKLRKNLSALETELKNSIKVPNFSDLARAAQITPNSLAALSAAMSTYQGPPWKCGACGKAFTGASSLSLTGQPVCGACKAK